MKTNINMPLHDLWLHKPGQKKTYWNISSCFYYFDLDFSKYFWWKTSDKFERKWWTQRCNKPEQRRVYQTLCRPIYSIHAFNRNFTHSHVIFIRWPMFGQIVCFVSGQLYYQTSDFLSWYTPLLIKSLTSL